MAPEPASGRNALPIPHPAHVGLVTYDAKDPDTAVPREPDLRRLK